MFMTQSKESYLPGMWACIV